MDLGPGFYDSRISSSRKMRNHVSQLEALGYKVTLEPTARLVFRKTHFPAPLRSAGMLRAR